jgi:ABC-2 type transport system permease protein
LAWYRFAIQMWSAYRVNAILDFSMELFRIVVLFFFWHAVYASNQTGLIKGYTLEEMIGYVFITVFIYSYTLGDTIFMISSRVKKGMIAQDLIRPVDFQLRFFFTDLGGKSILLLANGLALLLAITLFTIPHPTSLTQWGAFLLSLFLAGCIHFYLDFIISLISFHVTNLWGIVITHEAIFELCSGALIPLTFFPEQIQHFFHWLPWSQIIFTPATIYLNKSTIPVTESLITQGFWVIFLLVFGRIFFHLAIKKVTIHGG